MRCVLAMSALLAVPACAFTPAGGPGSEVDAGTDDEGNRFATRKLDSASELAAGEPALVDAVLEPYGALGPATYVTGALLAGFSNDRRFDQTTTATWAQVTTGTRDGTSLWSGLVGDPVGVGHQAGSGDWTYWAEGELWLPAGTSELTLRADDRGFVEVAADRATFTRIASASYLADMAGPVTVASAGWYPVRLALSQGGGLAELSLSVRDPGAASVPVPRERLRARVDGLRGLLLTGWSEEYLTGPVRGIRLDTALLAHEDFGFGYPADLGIGTGDRWSARWSGQVHVDAAGSYRLEVKTDNGQRLALGAMRDGQRWETSELVEQDLTVALDAGWNDLAFDVNEVDGVALAELELRDGPDGLSGPLPLARVRPLAPWSERLAIGLEPADAGIPNDQPTGVDAFVQVPAGEGATVTSVDLEVGLDHGAIGELELRLYHPDGTELLLRDNDGGGGNGARTLRYLGLTQLAGKPAGGRYVVRISDTRPGQSGTRTDVALVVHHAGGLDQVARVASYTSALVDLGAGVVAIDRLRFAGAIPPGTAIAVRARGCDDPGACASQPWSAPVTDPAGGAPALPATRYVQFQVELRSDGARGAELDWVAVDYRLPPQ